MAKRRRPSVRVPDTCGSTNKAVVTSTVLREPTLEDRVASLEVALRDEVEQNSLLQDFVHRAIGDMRKQLRKILN